MEKFNRDRPLSQLGASGAPQEGQVDATKASSPASKKVLQAISTGGMCASEGASEGLWSKCKNAVSSLFYATPLSLSPAEEPLSLSPAEEWAKKNMPVIIDNALVVKKFEIGCSNCVVSCELPFYMQEQLIELSELQNTSNLSSKDTERKQTLENMLIQEKAELGEAMQTALDNERQHPGYGREDFPQVVIAIEYKENDDVRNRVSMRVELVKTPINKIVEQEREE